MSNLKLINVKTVNLEKPFVKLIARIIYICGLGNVWYEPVVQSNMVKMLYKFWCFISNVFIVSVVISELLAVLFRDDLNVKELNDGIIFCLAHPTILLKFVTLHYKRDLIKDFYRNLLENTSFSFSQENEKVAIKKAKRFIVVVAISMCLCMSFATMESIWLHIVEGVPFQTLVTYWPRQSHRGILIDMVRILIQIQWWYLVFIMVAVDGLCITALTFLGFRFRSLQMLFNSFRTNLIENADRKSSEELEEDFKKSLILAVKWHSEILLCTRSLQQALGNIYNIQVFQNITLLSMCLIKLVKIERSIPFLLAVMTFIMCLLALTGAYMVLCGDITHEASLVPSAIFYSGWELCSARARLRPLLVLSIQRSQAPVIMTAFGIFDLSYQNFIQIIRSSYSFFAVMY